MDTYTAEEFAHTASLRGIARKADALKWCKLSNKTELVEDDFVELYRKCNSYIDTSLADWKTNTRTMSKGWLGDEEHYD